MNEYKVLSALTSSELASVVERYMSMGWMPQGGVSVDNGRLYQAITKVEDSEQEHVG